jgi:hypothetical protein
MRRGFDRLALEAKGIVGDEMQKGTALVVFANRGATRTLRSDSAAVVPVLHITPQQPIASRPIFSAIRLAEFT